MVCYEQPLNERVRTLLRLEFLFRQLDHALQSSSVWDSRTALQGLFAILNLTGRNELKSELLKELDRHSASLNRLRQTEGVDIGTLGTVLEELNRVTTQIHGLDNLAQEAVRQNEFLNTVRQRSSIPGGTCTFDLPALNHWLLADDSLRSRHLQDWLSPFRPLQAGARIILQLIRASATASQEIAHQGFFQKTLDSAAPSQMVRVILPLALGVFPEVSGGKHRFSICFMAQPDPNKRPVSSPEDIHFQLTCCII